MCNAYQHSDGCECGFGPPYLDSKAPLPQLNGKKFIGVIRERKREKWAAKGIVDRNKVTNGLEQLGLKPKWLNTILKKYSDAGYPIKESLWNELSKNQQQGAAQKMMRLMGLREEIIEELEPIDLEIPLFRLQPPKTEKSIVSYEEKHTKAHGWSVFVKVPGFAMGSDLSLHLQGEGIIQTSKNECKIIILPVSINRYRVNLFLGKICVARNKLVVEAGNKKTGQVLSRTIKTCRDYVSPSSKAVLIAEYNLIGDKSGINSRFNIGWGEKANSHAEIMIPIPGITAGIQIAITMEHEILLKFDLEPKRDYKLYPIPEGMGISWKVSKKTVAG
jgi:hypothetical protein